jgi:hypothetical protein
MMVIIKSHLTSPPEGGLRARLLPHLKRALLAALFLSVQGVHRNDWR